MALALAWLGRLTCGARAKSRGCENTPFRELKQGCLLRGMAGGGGGEESRKATWKRASSHRFLFDFGANSDSWTTQRVVCM